MEPSYTAAFVLFLREKFSSFSFDFVRRKKKKEDDLSAMQTKSIKVARSQSSNLLLSIDNLAIVIGDIFIRLLLFLDNGLLWRRSVLHDVRAAES